MGIDPKRTGVKARLIADWSEEDGRTGDGFRKSIPGDMLRTNNPDGSLCGFLIACPGCGQWGGINLFCKDRPQSNWTVMAGSPDDVTTLSVHPSILISCCGWHGFLKNGVFVVE